MVHTCYHLLAMHQYPVPSSPTFHYLPMFNYIMKSAQKFSEAHMMNIRSCPGPSIALLDLPGPH